MLFLVVTSGKLFLLNTSYRVNIVFFMQIQDIWWLNRLHILRMFRYTRIGLFFILKHCMLFNYIKDCEPLLSLFLNIILITVFRVLTKTNCGTTLSNL